METKMLSFSVQGEFITKLAREKCHDDGRLEYAIRVLMDCMQTDKLTDREIESQAYDILNGRARLAGVYPGPDYRLEYIPGMENACDIATTITKLQEKIKEQSEQIMGLQRRYLFMYDSISEWERRRILRAYINEGYVEDDPRFLEPIDADDMQGQDEYNMDIYDLRDDVSVREIYGNKVVASTDPTSPASRISQIMQNPGKALDEYMTRMTSEDDTDDDYGWLEPNGTYHPVPWGKHAEWAANYLDEHYPFIPGPNGSYAHLYYRNGANGEREYINNGDVLVYSLGWVLIDNPAQGMGRHTCRPDRPMTKAQKEFLYDYYRKRKAFREADALYESDD